MHYNFATILVAALAATSFAAPTPTKSHAKKTFKAHAKGHKHRSGKEAMEQAFLKFGWSCPSHDAQQQDPLAALESLFPASANPWWSGQASSSAIYEIITISGYGIPSATASASGFAAPSSGGFSPSQASVAPISSGFSAAPSSFSAAPSQASGAPPSGAPPSDVPQSSGWGAPSGSSPVASSTAAAPSASSPSTGGGSNEGSVAANPEDNESAYTSPVTIGGQQLSLDFDTGSADLWVFSTEMSPSAIDGHTAFNPAKSSTFKTYQGGSWQIQYGDGSTASGTVGFDSVNIGGVVASQQAVELAEQVSASFEQMTANDGLLGLGFSNINTVQPQQQKTFFENVMDSLDQPLFTADLTEDASGTYEFGAIDSSKYSGSISYTPIDNSNGWWQWSPQSVSIGGQSQACQTCSPVIADTGTSLIIWDNDVVESYYKGVSGAQFSNSYGAYVYPCSTTLPDFGIPVGDSFVATVPGANMNYGPASGSLCVGGLQPNEGNGINIAGDVFLKHFFAVFDGGNMQFGVAAKN